MLKPEKLILGSFLFFSITSPLYATPYVYTFKGVVVAPIIEDLMPVRVGDSAEYRFLVDRDLPGYQTVNGINTYNPNSYFSQLIEGNPYITLSIDEQVGWSYGFDDPAPGGRIQLQGSFDIPNTYASIYVYSYGDWTVGTSFEGHMQSRGPNNDYRDIYSTLTLTDISPVQSVPEPNQLAIFSFGILAMMPISIRLKNATYLKMGKSKSTT